MKSVFHNEPTKIERNISAGILVCALVVAAAVGNTLFTMYFHSLQPGVNTLHEFGLCVAIGALIAQPCLLSIWCFLLDQRIIIRVPVSMGILLGLTCLYISVLRSLENGNNLPAEAVLFLTSIPFACVLITGIPMLLLRLLGRRVISCEDSDQPNIESTQYGIRHMFFLMFLIAVLLLIAQRTFAGIGFQGSAPLIEIIVFVTLFGLLACLLCILSLALVFHPGSRLWSAALIVVSMLAAPALVIWILFSRTAIPGPIQLSYFVNASGFAASLAITQCATLALFYGLSFRMRPLEIIKQ